MKPIALKLAAAGLAVIFAACAFPAMAQDTTAPVPEATAEPAPGGAPAALRDQIYQDLKARLGTLDAPATEDPQAAETTLPDVFAKGVRGCTTDGLIYRFGYNLGYDINDIAAPATPGQPDAEKSLLHRTVRSDVNAILTVSGGSNFLDALKAMLSTVDDDLRERGGELLDQTGSADIDGPEFRQKLEALAADVAREIQQKYKVGITINIEEPRRQGEARCAADGETQPAPLAPAFGSP